MNVDRIKIIAMDSRGKLEIGEGKKSDSERLRGPRRSLEGPQVTEKDSVLCWSCSLDQKKLFRLLARLCQPTTQCRDWTIGQFADGSTHTLDSLSRKRTLMYWIVSQIHIKDVRNC